MTFQMPSFAPALPEMFVLAMACVILVADLYISQEQRRITYWLTQLTLVGAFLITLFSFAGESILTFNGSFVRDPMGDVLKMAVYAITAGVFLYAVGYLRARELFKGEFYVLGLFGVLGMMVMISAHSFLTLYLGLELLSLSLYAMVAFDRDNPRAAEAAVKYFVLGAIASGMLLYGMSMIYGITGSLDIAEVAQAIQAIEGQNLVLIFGLSFLVVALAFKLGAVPFHMWIPDVYQGAPTPVTLYVGSAPKIAAFAMFMRLLVDALGGMLADWQGMLILLAIGSMAIGNLVAIAQTNLKRMLAYSTIAHVGFILLGILSGTEDGYASAMFYTIIYAIMSLGGFGMIILLSRAGFEAEELEDFRGLNERSPWFAFLMLLIMFSMAGVPPMVGFYAKLSVLQAVVNVDLVWLAVVAVAFSVIGAFYYIRVIKLMYFDKAEDRSAIEADGDARVLIGINGLLMLGLGLFPSALMALCVRVMA